VYFHIKSNILFNKHIIRKVDMNKNQILEHGELQKWVGKIRKSTATSIGRSGLVNKAGIDVKAYNMLLRGNLASGTVRGGPIARP